MIKKNNNKKAFTRLELLVLVIVLFSLLTLFKLNSYGTSKKYTLSICKYNLMQIYEAFHGFSKDHEDKLPWEVATKDGGSADSLGSYKEHWKHWQVLSNRLSDPKVVRCPKDRNRNKANSFVTAKPRGSAGKYVIPFGGTRGNMSMSYFLSAEAKLTEPGFILAGDRNIFFGKYENDNDSKGAIKKLGKKFAGKNKVEWTESLHDRSGILLNSDGAISYTNNELLKDNLMNSKNKNNEVLFPIGKQ
jgi:hypothetical protein